VRPDVAYSPSPLERELEGEANADKIIAAEIMNSAG
jgi:hypothetical protein